MIVRDTNSLAGEHSTENKEGYIFIIKEKVEWEENHLSHSWVDVKAYLISSSFDCIWSN